jgi:hypothetical protein
MKNQLLGFALIAIGAVLIYQGKTRADSVLGVSESVGKAIANTVDGKARQPEHVYYYLGGGLFILTGVACALRKRS